MRERAGAVLIVLVPALAACRHVVGPPALFPMTTVWVAQVDDIVEGPLASDGTRVFVATREGSVRAVDPSGEVVWRRDGRPGRIAAAPGILVLREADGTVSRLEPETGATRWSAQSGIAGTLPPVLDGDRILVAGEGVAALDAAAGEPLWSVPGRPSAATAPVVHDRYVLLAEADGTLRARDRSSGAALWALPMGSVLRVPPVVDAEGRLLVGTTDRRFLAIDVEKGRRLWRWTVGADVQSPAALLHDHVLFVSFEDVLYALKRRNGHMIWRAGLPSRPLSGPLLVGDSVLVACYESDVVGFDGRTGRRLGGLRAPAVIRTSPLLVGDRLYVGLRDRTVVAYTLDLTPAKPAPAPTGPKTQQKRGVPVSPVP